MEGRVNNRKYEEKVEGIESSKQNIHSRLHPIISKVEDVQYE